LIAPTNVALREGWSWVRLAEVLRDPPVNGRSVRTLEGGFPVLRLTAIKPGGVDFSEHKPGAWTATEAAPFLATEGDFLLSRGNGSRRLVGRGALVRQTPMAAAFPDTMIRIRLNPSFVTREYFSHIWESPIIRTQIESKARTTAGIYKINQRILADIQLPLPSLVEQHRIVDILEHMLSRLHFVNENLAKCMDRLPTLRGAVRNDLTHYGEFGAPLPDGWSWGVLGDVLARIEAGKSFQCEPRPATQDEWGVIKVSAMTWGEFREDEQKAVPHRVAIDPRHEIKRGDILVSRANTPAYVGAPVLVRECRPRLLLSDKSLRLVPLAEVDRKWLLETLASPCVRKQISAKATGTKESMRNISQKHLREVRIPIPPLDTQASLGEALETANKGIDRLAIAFSSAQLRTKNLRNSLLNLTFTGSFDYQTQSDSYRFERPNTNSADGETLASRYAPDGHREVNVMESSGSRRRLDQLSVETATQELSL